MVKSAEKSCQVLTIGCTCLRCLIIILFRIVQYWTATVAAPAQHEGSSELKTAWFKLSTRLWRIKIMSKGKDSKKQNKKKPLKTLMEKRAAKRAKKENKSFSLVIN